MATARRSSSSYGGFADGIIIRGVPLLTLYPGNVYWVDSAGGGGSKGTFNHPCLTLAAAHDLVTTNNGDIIAIKPGHAESYTATVDFSKSGFAIIGLGFGGNRPTFTINVAAAGDDMFDFAGSDIVVYNIKVKEGSGAGSAAVLFNVSGDNFHIENCYLELGTDNTTFLTHDTTAKKGLSVVGNTIVGTATGPDVGIRVEKTHLYAHIAGNRWLLGQSEGIDSGVIVFVSGTTAAGEHLIEDEFCVGLSTRNDFLVQTDVQINSLMRNCSLIGTDASYALGDSTASGFSFEYVLVNEPGLNTTPALDIAGARPLALTPAA
jgi:hypothetical protein